MKIDVVAFCLFFSTVLCGLASGQWRSVSPGYRASGVYLRFQHCGDLKIPRKALNASLSCLCTT